MLMFKNVTFRYNKDTPILLQDFNISFPQNKISVLMSANGLGKTTILKLASHLLVPTKGKVINTNNKISYVFQEDRLIDELTVYQNLQMIVHLQKVPYYANKLVWNKKTHKFERKKVRKLRHFTKEEEKEKIQHILKQLDLLQCINYYPSELSGSMKKRVAMARAFLHPSQLLLMDEPFNNLDIELKNEIIKGFVKLWSKTKRTVIFVTHSIDEALSLANKVYLLSNRPLTITKQLNIEGSISKRDISSHEMVKYRKQILDFFLEKTKEEHK